VNIIKQIIIVFFYLQFNVVHSYIAQYENSVKMG